MQEVYLTNYGCDGNADHYNRIVRRLDTGGGSGLFLCKQCWHKEMIWRKERNQDLEPSNRFDILPW